VQREAPDVADLIAEGALTLAAGLAELDERERTKRNTIESGRRSAERIATSFAADAMAIERDGVPARCWSLVATGCVPAKWLALSRAGFSAARAAASIPDTSLGDRLCRPSLRRLPADRARHLDVLFADPERLREVATGINNKRTLRVLPGAALLLDAPLSGGLAPGFGRRDRALAGAQIAALDVERDDDRQRIGVGCEALKARLNRKRLGVKRGACASGSRSSPLWRATISRRWCCPGRAQDMGNTHVIRISDSDGRRDLYISNARETGDNE
jgi:hypothetical protein